MLLSLTRPLPPSLLAPVALRRSSAHVRTADRHEIEWYRARRLRTSWFLPDLRPLPRRRSTHGAAAPARALRRRLRRAARRRLLLLSNASVRSDQCTARTTASSIPCHLLSSSYDSCDVQIYLPRIISITHKKKQKQRDFFCLYKASFRTIPLP